MQTRQPDSPPKRPRPGRDLVLVVLATAVVAALLELFLVWGGRGAPAFVNYEFYANLSGDLPPNLTVTDNLIRGLPYRVTTDAQGFRVANPRTSGQTNGRKLRILCLGDSFTYGVGVDDAQTYPYLLGETLRREHPDRTVEIINAGIPFFDIVDELDYFEDKGQALAPDIVVCQFYYNDIQTMNGQSFRRSRRLPAKTYGLIASWIKNTRTVQLSQALAYKFLGASAKPQGKISDAAWNAGRHCLDLNPNQIAVVNDAQRLLDQANIETIRCRWDAYGRTLLELREAVVRQGAAFLLVLVPDRTQLAADKTAPSQYLTRFAAQHGIPCLDALMLFRAAFNRHKTELYNDPYDFHLNKIGNTLLAGAVAQAVQCDAEGGPCRPQVAPPFAYDAVQSLDLRHDGNALSVEATSKTLPRLEIETRQIAFQGKGLDTDKIDATARDAAQGELRLVIELPQPTCYFSVELHPMVWSADNKGLTGYAAADEERPDVMLDIAGGAPKEERTLYERHAPDKPFSRISLTFVISQSTGIAFGKPGKDHAPRFVVRYQEKPPAQPPS